MFFLEFIRGLLENIGAKIDPIRLIRRIRNSLEISSLFDFDAVLVLYEPCAKDPDALQPCPS
jgi:hypothetical protein